MQTEITLEQLKRMNVIPPRADSTVEMLYSGAVKNFLIDIEDYLTIRDICVMGDASLLHDEVLIALLLCMFLALEEGSLCLKIDRDTILLKLDHLLEERKTGPGLAARIIEKVLKNQYPDIISSNPDEFTPMISYQDEGSSYLYFQKYFIYERRLKDQFIRILGTRADEIESEGHLRDLVQEVLEKNAINGMVLDVKQKIGIVLALMNNCTIISGGPGTGKTSIIIALVRCLVRMGIPADRIRLAAPTGRAAQRITGAVSAGLAGIQHDNTYDKELGKLKGTTIHSLLKYKRNSNRFLYNSSNHIPADCIIVDEVSMVDVVTITRLMESLDSGARIILLGDKDQLPSVEAGTLLADIVRGEQYSIFSKGTVKRLEAILDSNLAHLIDTGSEQRKLLDRVVVLDKSFRSGESILAFSREINNQNDAVVDTIREVDISAGYSESFTSGNEEFRMVEWPHEDEQGDEESLHGVSFLTLKGSGTGRVRFWQDILYSWVQHCYFSPQRKSGKSYIELLKEIQQHSAHIDTVNSDLSILLDELFTALNRFRILTLLRKGPYGAAGVNRHIERIMRNALDVREARMLHGAPIVITRNDPRRELYNGDIGIILKGDSSYYAVFRFLDSYRTYPVHALPVFELAYAITVHKSQGSEYEEVMIILPDEGGSRMLSKEIIYTGITRAKKSACICGRKETLRKAIKRKITRMSGMTF